MAFTALVQVGLAGGYLGGDYDALAMHQINAFVLAGLALITMIIAIWFRRTGGPKWQVPVSIVLFIAVPVQATIGTNRIVPAHIALGVLIVSTIAVLVTLAWIAPGAPAQIESAESERNAELVS
ncbi:hypothetical protein [Streptomyces sp. 8N616]|uniref:hypothetical protein n=1 Tax=Streptomyces sp. 8N616 TaxID=3457414 RepID=UPI003FD5087A